MADWAFGGKVAGVLLGGGFAGGAIGGWAFGGSDPGRITDGELTALEGIPLASFVLGVPSFGLMYMGGLDGGVMGATLLTSAALAGGIAATMVGAQLTS